MSPKSNTISKILLIIGLYILGGCSTHDIREDLYRANSTIDFRTNIEASGEYLVDGDTRYVLLLLYNPNMYHITVTLYHEYYADNESVLHRKTIYKGYERTLRKIFELPPIDIHEVAGEKIKIIVGREGGREVIDLNIIE
jgi:uncharacterized protein YcfL